MAGVSNTCRSSVHKMFAKIMEERSKEANEDAFVVVPRSDFWSHFFSTYFLKRNENDHAKSDDDMLFFVSIKEGKTRKELQTKLNVYRKDARNLPSLGDPVVNWEETVYLNLILQRFEYILTCAVCKKLENGDLHILHKRTERVHAVPNRCRMDKKGEEAEFSYPNIYFMINSFDRVFDSIIVEEDQMVCVELMAEESSRSFKSVIFLGSLKFNILRKVYEEKATIASKVAKQISLGAYKGGSNVEFIRMKGPQGKGQAEMALTPCRIEGESATESENDLSPVGSTSGSAATSPVHAVTLTKENNFGDYDVDSAPSTSWKSTVRRKSADAVRWLRNRNRQQPRAFNACLTYVTLPWHRIIADVLEVRQRPLLTFER